MEENKTIKQLAEQLGYSKAYVDKTIRLLNMHTELRRVGNKYVINKTQEKLIIKSLKDKKTPTDTHTKFSSESEIMFLRAQMENKDRELERMQKLLDQQQQLTLQSNKQIDQLQQQLLQLTPPDEPKKEQEMPEKVPPKLDQIEVLEKVLAEQKQTSLETQQQFLALQEKMEMLELVNKELESSLENKSTEIPQDNLSKKAWWHFWK